MIEVYLDELRPLVAHLAEFFALLISELTVANQLLDDVPQLAAVLALVIEHGIEQADQRVFLANSQLVE